MTRSEAVAWAAGIFEGEGCISRHSDGRGGGVLIVRMTDRDVLERFLDIVEAGGIRGPLPTYQPHHKPSFEWRAARWDDVSRILADFLPWLGARRSDKATQLLAHPVGLGGRKDQTHCIRDHPLSGPDSDVLVSGTRRSCRICRRQRAIETRELRAA